MQDDKTKAQDDGIHRKGTPEIRITNENTNSTDNIEVPIEELIAATRNKRGSDASETSTKSTQKSSSCWTHHDGPG